MCIALDQNWNLMFDLTWNALIELCPCTSNPTTNSTPTHTLPTPTHALPTSNYTL